MGEYAKYLGVEMKIGTCESLYYVSYSRMIAAYSAGRLVQSPYNLEPAAYLAPNSGFRFRFPFPDEDSIPLGKLGYPDFDRGLSVKVNDLSFVRNPTLKQTRDGLYQVDIVQQKLVNRESDKKLILAVVLDDRTPDGRYRLEDETEVRNFLKQLVRWNILSEQDPNRKALLRTVGVRILKGYRLNIDNVLQIDNAPRIMKEMKPRNGLSK